MIPGSVIGDPVQNDCDAFAMRQRHKIADILQGAIARRDALVVLYTVGGSHTVYRALGKNGHEPDRIDV